MSMHRQDDGPELEKALSDHGLPHDTPSQLADAFRCGWAYRKPKPLVWHRGNVGVHHRVAHTAFGLYHLWGNDNWAGPNWRRGQDGSYTKSGENGAAAYADYYQRVVDLY